ncbi:MAG: phosphate regulon sensor histidine kinase PhoR [Alcanivorax sp.]|nr:phosphate regulon sensor histidine kinase PhoR [Alcanivorax sp.]
MTPTLRNEIRRLALILVAALILSLLIDSIWPAFIAMLGCVIFSTRQLIRLSRWLITYERTQSAPPESKGAWGDLFDRLYHLLRREKSARHELEFLMTRAESSITALRDAIVVVDRQGRLEYWNRAADKLLGFKAPHDKQQTLTNLIRDPRFAHYLKEGSFDHPLTLPSPADEHRMLEFTITRFGAGDWLVIVRDVTRLHNLEQMRKDFVGNVSHELKTPLTVLKGYLETLMDSVPAEQKRIHRALLQMNQQSQRMEALINDLLLLARLEGTEPDLDTERLALAPMLRRLRQDGLAMATDKQQEIQLEVAPGAALLGNPAELHSAFANLVTNAVKYTPAGGKISIRWWEDASGGHLAVSDNGVGIDAEHIPRLTERFYRPDASRVTQTGGTGLGLAIVKHVLLRHDATLTIQSQPERGSTFTCHFPDHRLASEDTVASA